MGCDIHCYVEYRQKNPKSDYEKRWRAFGKRINPGRNYAMFNAMAGVRGNGNAVVDPRGLPDDCDYYANEDAFLYIKYSGEPGEGETTPEKAAEWHERCGCTYRGTKQAFTRTTHTAEGPVVESVDAEHAGKPTHVAHPDWHTHSWLTAEEFSKAIERVATTEPHYGVGIEYYALLAAMREIDARGYDSRIVFWFDN